MRAALQVQKKQTQVYKHNTNFKMKYLGPESIHFPTGPSHTSPCMSRYWRAQPVRTGIVRDEIEHEDKPELEGEE